MNEKNMFSDICMEDENKFCFFEYTNSKIDEKQLKKQLDFQKKSLANDAKWHLAKDLYKKMEKLVVLPIEKK